MQDFKTIVEQQRHFFATGATLPISFRIEQLKKLKFMLQAHEAELAAALKKDLNKAPQEAIANDVILVTREIEVIIKHLKNWARPQKVPTPFPAMWPGRSEIYFEPYGCTLILGPWNFPVLLTLSPLLGAICAGNCAIVKPSEVAPHTQHILVQLINDHFLPEYVTAIKADVKETQELLKEKFDYIFFTGGTQVGKIIMEAAAKHLTPVTLELGGKSPCIVDASADLDFAARRIAWAKTTNAGQICLAPDYLYVQRSCKAAFVEKLQNTLRQFYGDDPEKSDSYARIINTKHFDRLIQLMQSGKIIFGGQTNADDLFIAPTLIDEVTWDDPIMQEEIFGPLLPILTFDDMEDVISAVKKQPKSLALYLFSNDKDNEETVLQHLSFGGGCINDCLMHIVNENLPFGGVGPSGMGQYHGKYSFETFSHRKSVYKKLFPLDLRLEYPPFSSTKLRWFRRLING